jgi:iron-sulfur cluster assembly protein
MNTFPLIIHPQAIKQLQKLLARKGEPGNHIRVGVKGGGCRGLEYILKIDSRLIENDLVEEFDGLKVVCDPKSATYLKGTEIIYTGDLMRGGFAFKNPNAQVDCGCGTSFTPKS